MADWIAHASEVVRTFMDKGSLADGILMLFLAYGGSFVMIAVHEAGHALAAVLTGNRVRELRVGHSDDVTFAAGSFRLRLGRLRDGEQRGGYVICNAPTATPGQLMIIALAGPGANLLGAAATALPAIRAEGMLAISLFLLTVGHLAMALRNLRPTGDPGTPAEWNDGRWALAAWAARHAGPVTNPPHLDPNTATSVPPPR